MNKLFLLISFCFIINNIEAQTFIYGKQPTYKNYELIFYTFSDPFTGNDIEVGRCTTDSSGNFSVELPIDETLLVYTYLGIFKGYIYVEPKKSYEILFPDKQEKTPADRLNPFFEPVEFHFSIKNQPSDDINNLIIKFDTVYYKCFEKIISSS